MELFVYQIFNFSIILWFICTFLFYFNKDCPPEHILCPGTENSPQCITELNICDGTSQCPDGFDEINSSCGKKYILLNLCHK